MREERRRPKMTRGEKEEKGGGLSTTAAQILGDSLLVRGRVKMEVVQEDVVPAQE